MLRCPEIGWISHMDSYATCKIHIAIDMAAGDGNCHPIYTQPDRGWKKRALGYVAAH